MNRKKPHPVIGNFPINNSVVKYPENYHYVPNHDMNADILTSAADDFWARSGIPFREDYLTIVLDEVQLIFNSRLWQQKDRLQYLEFLSQHRKYGYKVILVAQSAKMIDNQFRMLVEYEIKHRKVSNLGPMGALFGLLTFGRLFWQISYYYQNGERLGMDWYLMRRKDAALYDSRARFARLGG